MKNILYTLKSNVLITLLALVSASLIVVGGLMVSRNSKNNSISTQIRNLPAESSDTINGQSRSTEGTAATSNSQPSSLGNNSSTSANSPSSSSSATTSPSGSSGGSSSSGTSTPPPSTPLTITGLTANNSSYRGFCTQPYAFLFSAVIGVSGDSGSILVNYTFTNPDSTTYSGSATITASSHSINNARSWSYPSGPYSGTYSVSISWSGGSLGPKTASVNWTC